MDTLQASSNPSASVAQTAGAAAHLAFAADFPSLELARPACAALRGEVGTVKVGLELFTRYGPDACALASAADAALFLDLKLHDIPATVGRAVTSAASLGARYLTVHAAGGEAMLAAAVTAAAQARYADAEPMQIVAVTVLTSLDEADLAAQAVPGEVQQHVLRLAQLAWRAGVRAFVCSPHEAATLRRELGPEATLITPGVRPAGMAVGDQKRVQTPAAAIRAGANLLVVGRPIRNAEDPVAAAAAIRSEVAAALATG